MPEPGTLLRIAAGLLVLGVLLTGCSAEKGSAATASTGVPDSELEKLLLGVAEVGRVMETAGLVPQPVAQTMNDDRNLLPNLDCLGVWQPDQAAIYGEQGTADGWRAVRQQTLRAPDVDDWSTLVLQSVVSYPSAATARGFFDQSAERWSKCTNHHVNIRLNDQPLPKWLSGDLSRTENQLAMPISRGEGVDSRVCQHVLSVRANVVIDVEACRPPTPVITQASAIAAKIESAVSA